MIQAVSIDEKEEWNRILSFFPQADVYFTREYVNAFVLNGDGEAILLYYPGEDIQGMNVVLKRPCPVPETAGGEDAELRSYYDLVTPYGYGGFLISTGTGMEKPGISLNTRFCFDEAGSYLPEQENLLTPEAFLQAKEKLANAYREYCAEHRIVCEFNRYHTVIGNAHALENLYDVRDLGHTVCMDLSSEDAMWANFTSGNRNVIRKAQKLGVTVKRGRSPELYEQFREIYNETMDKVGAEGYYYFSREFYDSIYHDLGEQAQLFYAEYEGEIAAIAIILFGGNQMHYHLSASRRRFQTLGATNVILYEAARYGISLGMKTFHLGGGLGSHEDSLYQFKKRFHRGADTRFSIGRATFLPGVYERLCRINIGDKETGFFPAYRDI